MTSRERIRKALLRQKVDRIPIVNIFNMNFLSKEFREKGKPFSNFENFELNDVIDFQYSILHDPVYYLHTYQEPEVVKLPDTFIRGYMNHKTWTVSEEVSSKKEKKPIIKRTYTTPSGSMCAILRREQFQAWVLEHPLDERKKIELLQHRPDPENMDFSLLENIVSKVGSKAFSTVGIPSVWQEACAMRGMQQLIFDMVDDPMWLKEFFSLLADYSVRIAEKIAGTGVDSIFINESYVGIGMARNSYLEFVLPYDAKIIEAANNMGLITSLHICGKCDALLEDMAESGAHCIEPLASSEYAGDVELSDAYKRVGEKVGIWGGFGERVLDKEKTDVKSEVFRCINAVEGGKGYVLRGMGQVYSAKRENLKYLAELVEEYIYSVS